MRLGVGGVVLLLFPWEKCLRDGFYLQLVASNQGYRYSDSKVAVGTAKQKHEVGGLDIKHRDYSKAEKTADYQGTYRDIGNGRDIVTNMTRGQGYLQGICVECTEPESPFLLPWRIVKGRGAGNIFPSLA